MKKVTNPDEYLKSKVSYESSGCWLWQGPVDKNGYGLCGSREISQRAHRAAWEVWKGAIPTGHFVCHRCDTPACINPEHLFLGTPRDNMDDKHSKNRQRYLTRDDLPTTKIRSSDVEFIKQHYKPRSKGPYSGTALAKKFGCSLAAISRAYKSGE